jgi:hypothetical protein
MHPVAYLVLIVGAAALGAAVAPSRFYPYVEASGIYQEHNRLTMQWADQSWHSSRAECIKRTREMAKAVTDMLWYVRGFKLDRSPRQECRDHL